ncbi:MAG: ABC transporter substrate-binding protein [Acidimicrobiales bacterium]
MKARIGRARWAAVACCLSLALAACGSSRSEEDIAAANAALVRLGGGTSGSTQAGAGGLTGGGASTETGGSAAVGSSGGDAGASDTAGAGGDAGAAAAGGAAGAASGAPIRLGSVGTFSGPIGALLEAGRQGILVWASWVNAHGGINGHPVEVVVADDQNDPSQHQAAIRDMVEQQGVVAIINNLGPFTSTAAVQYLEQNQIPVIGGDAVSPAWTDSPVFFPASSNFDAFIGALATQAHLLGPGNLGILACAESSFCTVGTNVVSEYAQRYEDIPVTYTAQITLTAPDYTAECLAAEGNDVQYLIIGADAATIGRIATSCARQGYNPIYGVPSLTAVPALAENPAITRLFSGQGFVPWFSSEVPAIAEYQEAMATYGGGAAPSSPSAGAWVAGKLLEAAASRITGDVTSQALLDALNSLSGDTLGGLTVPLTFGPTPRIQPDCFFWVEIDGGQWVAPRGSQQVCN